MTDFVANFELEQNNFDANFELENVQFDAIFEINPAGAAWGTITGKIADQTDLINLLNEKVDISDFENLEQTVTDNYNDLSADITNNSNNITLLQNAVNSYGDIVAYNAADFATKNQGLLADTALQPNDNITELVNNAGFITSADLPTVNNNTITLQKNGTNIDSFTLNQNTNKSINITVPTNTNELTNGAGFITKADLPTLADLTTTAQLAAINSGATSTNIAQIATNTQAITTEVNNRQNADINLQSQIDAIVSSSDVFDIVGTYAELQAYDIATVPVNDIIKVLVDSTHNNAATYYRCVESGSVKSWSYIGAEGAYYTKSESDNRFVAKTITVNGQPLSSNVTLTASDVGALPDSTTIPTMTSQLTNDSGFITNSALSGYATESWVNNKGYITGITSSDITTALGYTPYNASNPNGYITSSALADYVTNTSLATTLADYVTNANLTTILADYAELTDLPTKTSDLNNDSGFITGITSSDVTTALGYTPYNSTNPNGYITSSALTNYVTTNTAQDISGRKTFLGEKAIYFKQSATTNKLGFTLYNPSSTELGAFEWRPSTIGSGALLNINVPYSSSNYVGFRYWGTAVNIVAPKVATAGNYYIPTHITNGSTTVTASNNGTVNISTLLPTIPTVGNGTITINQGGTQKGTFTVNQSGDTTINLDAGGGGGTVDQTFNGSSANAQSGVAIAGANFVQNTATGTDALTISGTATTKTGATNIGMSSVAGDTYTVALGYNAQASSGTSSGSVVIGTDANSSDVYGIAIGHSASVSVSNAIQLGSGTNSTGGLQVYSYQLLDNTTGLIPDARISSNIARTSQIPSITVDQTFNGSSANAQSGIAIAGAGFLQNTAGASGSLAILGTTSYNYAIALGDSANANDTSAIAIGYSAYANYPQTIALGISAQTTAAGTVAIGGNATATAARAHAFGYLSEASASGATALGYEAKATASGALQIGTGTNTTANSLQVSSYTLLDTSTGIIPTARLGTNVDGQWVDVDQAIISSATSLNGSTGLTYRVDLPNDGHKYEVMIRGAGYVNSTAGNDLWIVVSGNQDSMTRYMCRARAGTAGTFAGIGTVICTMSYVASSEKNLTVSRSTSWNGSCTELKVIAYRRIGTNT